MEEIFKKGFNPFQEYKKPEYIQLLTDLKQQQFRLSDTGVNPRIFNQWKNAGLVYGINNDRKWTALSFGQYIWLMIIRDLRAFGVTLEDIRHIKDYLTIDIYEAVKKSITEEKLNALKQELSRVVAIAQKEGGETPNAHLNEDDLLKDTLEKHFVGGANMIELSLIHMLLSGKASFLTILLTNNMPAYGFNFNRSQRQQKEGTGKRKRALRQDVIACFIDTEDFSNMNVDTEKVSKLYNTPHLKIPLMHYVREFIADENNESKLEQMHLLRSGELALLRELRKDHVKSVEVVMEQDKITGENKINRFEIKKEMKKEEETRLIETFTSKEYAKIEYQVENGKIMHFTKVTKIKPNQ